jgi:membrane protein DedA with SNARE-associated domain
MADDQSGQAQEAPPRRARRLLRRPAVLGTLLVLVLVVVAFVLHIASGSDGFSLIDETSGDLSYLAIFLLVFGDAICPILPGETTLNAASTLAAQGVLDLGLVMVAGAAGAVLGDSTLYWIARIGGKRFQPRLDKPMHNEQVVAALNFIGSRAPLLLVVGRYVPGLRFVINATFGLSAYRYPHFLLWSAIGGTIWSIYTCGLAYLVGTALADFPLASVIISGAITTAALGVIFLVVRRSRKEAVAS